MSRKKRRTREHVLADLSVNHIERFVYQSGFSCERVEHDYGIDLLMFTYAENGEIENGHVQIQVKATDCPKHEEAGQAVACRTACRDLVWWSSEPLPVILTLYDAQMDRAYWLYIQRELEDPNSPIRKALRGTQATATVRIPVANRLGGDAILMFRDFRNQVLKQVKGVIRHGD